MRAAGLDPDQPIEWDHHPPLQQRLWDSFIGDTSPRANDDRFLFPRQKADHREKTAKRDIPEIAKTKRLAKTQEAFRERLLDPEKKAREKAAKKFWGSRPFLKKP